MSGTTGEPGAKLHLTIPPPSVGRSSSPRFVPSVVPSSPSTPRSAVLTNEGGGILLPVQQLELSRRLHDVEQAAVLQVSHLLVTC